MKTPTNPVKTGTLALLIMAAQQLFALGGGSVMGQVTDPDTHEPVSDATVIFECEGTQKMFFTNEKGYYYAGNIPAGLYNIAVSYMSTSVKITGVKVMNDEVQEIPIAFSTTVQMPDIVFTDFRRKIIDPYHIEETYIDRSTFKHMAVINTAQLTETLAGVVKINGEEYVHGARAGALSYYIDGCLVMGNANIPLCGLDTYRSMTGFIPAKYGDTTGGVIVMETRNYFAEQ